MYFIQEKKRKSLIIHLTSIHPSHCPMSLSASFFIFRPSCVPIFIYLFFAETGARTWEMGNGETEKGGFCLSNLGGYPLLNNDNNKGRKSLCLSIIINNKNMKFASKGELTSYSCLQPLSIPSSSILPGPAYVIFSPNPTFVIFFNQI